LDGIGDEFLLTLKKAGQYKEMIYDNMRLYFTDSDELVILFYHFMMPQGS
jgi:hypothetical protein